MALNPSAGDILNVRFTYTNPATATAMNVLHYRVGSLSGSVPGMPTFLATIAVQLAEEWKAVWRPVASNQVTLADCRVVNVYPLPRSVGVITFPSIPRSGSVDSEALPLQDSVTILKRTAVGARWGLGRIFMVGIAEADQANGAISADLLARYGDVSNWIGSARTISGTGWNAVLNPCLIRGPEDNPVSITNILSAQVSNTIIKTMRRRRPGKGV